MYNFNIYEWAGRQECADTVSASTPDEDVLAGNIRIGLMQDSTIKRLRALGGQ